MPPGASRHSHHWWWDQCGYLQGPSAGRMGLGWTCPIGDAIQPRLQGWVTIIWHITKHVIFSQLGYAHGIAMPYTTSFCTKATSLYITLHHRTFVQSLTVINPQREIEYIYIASRCAAFHCEFFFIALSIQVCSAHSILIYIWLVVWNMAFIFPLENIWDSHPNWLSLHHFSEG